MKQRFMMWCVLKRGRIRPANKQIKNIRTLNVGGGVAILFPLSDSSAVESTVLHPFYKLV